MAFEGVGHVDGSDRGGNDFEFVSVVPAHLDLMLFFAIAKG